MELLLTGGVYLVGWAMSAPLISRWARKAPDYISAGGAMVLGIVYGFFWPIGLPLAWLLSERHLRPVGALKRFMHWYLLGEKRTRKAVPTSSRPWEG